MEQAERIITLRDNFERNLRRAARQHERLLRALREAGDGELELSVLHSLTLTLAEFHADLAGQLAGDDDDEDSHAA